jgi:hypothetical protein
VGIYFLERFVLVEASTVGKLLRAHWTVRQVSANDFCTGDTEKMSAVRKVLYGEYSY